MERPTLEEQIRIIKMTEEELNEALCPSHGWDGLNLRIFHYAPFLWRLIHWNWFCIWCGKRHFAFSDRECKRKEGNNEPGT